jgi:hypothetical protein
VNLHALLKRFIPHREMGWTEIGEEFTRFWLLRTRWGSVLMHRIRAPKWHPECHDHPWSFLAVVLVGGYWERCATGTFWRPPGSVLFRDAAFAHNVLTTGVAWSIVFTGPKVREWGLVPCSAT